MGSAGMRTSLVSREVIADSIELVARGNLFDALVVLVGCDKTIPAAAMALARLDIPGLILYGGSIAPGRFARARRHHPGRVRGGRRARGRDACPTRICARSKTTPAPAPARAAGSSPPTPWPRPASFSGSRRSAAATCRPVDSKKDDVAERSGALVMDVLKRGPPAVAHRHARRRSRTRSPRSPRPVDRPTPCSISMAIAREAGVTLALEDFDRVSARVPLLADLKPGRPLRRDRSPPRRRHPARREPPARRRRPARRRDHRDAARRSARKPRPRSKRPARRSCGRWPRRSSQPAAS